MTDPNPTAKPQKRPSKTDLALRLFAPPTPLEAEPDPATGQQPESYTTP